MNFQQKMYYTIFTLGIVFNFLETWYFGWNLKAMSPLESQCDTLAVVIVLAGVIGGLFSKTW